MKITGNVRNHAAEQANAEEDAMSRGMREKSKELFGSGAAILHHASTHKFCDLSRVNRRQPLAIHNGAKFTKAGQCVSIMRNE
jgi:hypothetical protein